MRLIWHDYRYYPYEQELAAREVAALFDGAVLHEIQDGLELVGKNDDKYADRLAYFSGVTNGRGIIETTQNRLEDTVRYGKARQATRYSVHGLHEFKGKFNPQVVRALLNIFGITSHQHVLDPFCGSGTTLVECSHVGIPSYGIDVNPFAVFIANAKLKALDTPADSLQTILQKLSTSLRRTKCWDIPIDDNRRNFYLQSWFDLKILQTIEIIRIRIEEIAGSFAPIFLTIASNLLRDYSLQDPQDLRIRRRKSPLPDKSFPDAFIEACIQSIKRIDATQTVLNTTIASGKTILGDVTTMEQSDIPTLFDASITSPPYAMALPYIDTQRLSLVWLNLLEPDYILGLESELIGSREFRGSARKTLISALERNEDSLPKIEIAFCHKLLNALSDTDGFRRQAVPMLLYRYFASMQRAFQAIRRMMHIGAPFALIVGHNHSVLGGTRYNIDTPAHLASIASNVGWTMEELVPLQTYHRYGYHMNNAIEAETLIILRNP